MSGCRGLRNCPEGFFIRYYNKVNQIGIEKSERNLFVFFPIFMLLQIAFKYISHQSCSINNRIH